MIIERIQSENFLKYAKLDIKNLPTKGVIAVSGQNESGKSSIGETLCFALFGRTFSLDLNTPQKLIRWGKSRCQVSVDFTAGRRHVTYRVIRYLDDNGAYGAQLLRLDDEVVLAKGPKRVNTELTGLLHFGYEEFIESFYLAQRELTTPHPHSHTIKVMAGIAPMTEAEEALGEQARQDGKELSKVLADFESTEQQLEALKVDDNWVSDLDNVRNHIHEAQSQYDTQAKGLQQAKVDYANELPHLQKKQAKRRLFWGLSLLTLVFSALLWAFWGMLNVMPDNALVTQITTLFSGIIPEWEEGWQPHLSSIATGFSAAFAFFALVTLFLKLSAKKIQLKVQHLAAHIGVIRQSFQSTHNAPLPSKISALLEKAGVLHDNREEDQDTLLGVLESKAQKQRIRPQQVEEVIEPVESLLQDKQTFLGQQAEVIEEAINVNQRKFSEAKALKVVENSLKEKIVKQEHRLNIHSKAISLLDSAAHHLSQRFNHSILRLAGSALPQFTENRYQHLKIDDNLDVRVFSSEKHDFMEFDETSTGTQRQVMLALRLAMSQELVKATESWPQFIFFDEPFAFFDQNRIRNTLNALPDISKQITQIWLVAQEFPTGSAIDMEIHCEQEKVSIS